MQCNYRDDFTQIPRIRSYFHPGPRLVWKWLPCLAMARAQYIGSPGQSQTFTNILCIPLRMSHDMDLSGLSLPDRIVISVTSSKSLQTKTRMLLSSRVAWSCTSEVKLMCHLASTGYGTYAYRLLFDIN
jgi:hypothetical protein